MKRIPLIAVVVALVASVTACGDSKEQKAEKAKDVFIQPYTKEIPRETGKYERSFVVKPAQEKK